MEIIPVRLGKEVNGRKLEEALLNAAVELGLCVTDRRDEFEEEYQLNPAIRKKVYGKTIIRFGEPLAWFANVE
ncbi:MAG: hypothetical protein Q8N63_04055, partial [Nanoarchaeota archaeon]|nr:hypothetical protein [Nanoarchaeota archaeon]